MVKSNSLKLTLCAGIALAGSVLPASVFAGTSVVSGKESKAVVEETHQSAITGDLGVNLVSQYVSRGLVKENQGVIAQPYVDLYFNLYEGDAFVNKVSLVLGVWSSLHSANTQQGLAEGHPGRSTTSAWYEFDYTPGIAVTFARNFTLTSSYFEFDSPNGAFDPQRSVNFRLDYNDADALGAFALHPHVTYLRELDGKTGTGDRRGNYYEAGIAPGLPVGPLTVTVPVTAGFGSNGFYATNQSFGFFSAGVNASVPLSFIPAAYGTWTANAGATYYYLHGSLAAANDIQSNDHNDFVFNGGIGMAF